MKAHELKCDPEPFQAAWESLKKSEIRYNDRDYQVGDFILLKETTLPASEIKRRARYTGRQMFIIIEHIQEGYGIMPGHVLMSFSVIECKGD